MKVSDFGWGDLCDGCKSVNRGTESALLLCQWCSWKCNTREIMLAKEESEE